MGQPDQFTKRTFASDAELVTGGAFLWKEPPESSLTWVKGDGLLLVRKPEAVAALPAPWSRARDHGEIFLEVKMPGDPVSALVLDRIDLRRLARQIQRAEDPKTRWIGEEPLWAVAPHVPGILRERRAVEEVAPGCYRVGPYPFDYLWIAANELPLREELIPFLIVRSGNALQEFGWWVLERRPVDWLVDMVQFTRMATTVANELLERIRRTTDPEMRARHLVIARKMVELEGLDKPIEHRGRLNEARAMLRRVLAARKLEVSPHDGEQIDACADLTTIERWVGQAATATSITEALRDG